MSLERRHDDGTLEATLRATFHFANIFLLDLFTILRCTALPYCFGAAIIARGCACARVRARAMPLLTAGRREPATVHNSTLP